MVYDESVIDLSSAARHLGQHGREAKDILGLLDDWGRNFEWLQKIDQLLEGEGPDGFVSVGDRLSELRIFAPIANPPKMLCVASNYADHVVEMRSSRYGMAADTVLTTDFNGKKAATRPYAFLKAGSSVVGPYDNICLPKDFQKVDWEAELAVVIGRRGKRISEGNAKNHIAGYMTFNDISCRDAMWRPDRETLRSDWLGSKSFDTFAPMGPFFVPAAFVPDHMQLRIRCKVNGAMMQDGTTAGLIFSPEEQISYFSKTMTLVPGDVFVTGTPGGVGQSRGIFLSAGDILETEVEGLGVQRNLCVSEESWVPQYEND